jgi:hypothetical protein
VKADIGEYMLLTLAAGNGLDERGFPGRLIADYRVDLRKANIDFNPGNREEIVKTFLLP